MSSLSTVTSPPYDVVVRPDGQDHLETLDPYNIVRLILPRDSDPTTRHRQAARTLRRWREERILVTDRQPALYLYEQRAADGSLQRGLIGALRLSNPDERIVLPHERVLSGPVADRAGLMRATAANLEPLLLAYRGDDDEIAGTGRNDRGTERGTGETARIVAATAHQPPLLATTTEDGTRHRLWAITDPAQIAAIDADLAPRQALIADGHHRWATYLRLRDEQPAGHAGPWDRGLVLLVDTARYPLRIRAIHRVLHDLPVAAALAAVREAYPAACTVKHLGTSLPAALEALAAAETAGPAGPGAPNTPAGRNQNSYLLAGDGAFHLLTLSGTEQVMDRIPPDQPEAWRRLDATVLHNVLIDHVWGMSASSEGIGYVHDAPAAVRRAEQLGGTAVLMHPVEESIVLDLAREGVMMPHKSTSFGPKPASGLVLRSLETG